MAATTPLSGIRVLEFAGLAPGPFAGMLCADWGASVVRIDRPTTPGTLGSKDLLARRKSSLMVNLKSAEGIEVLKELIQKVDILIDPFRPGVLEKLGLDPKVLLEQYPRLIIARMTGFRRDGKYKDMAGHDINYVAVSGVLSMLGNHDVPPSPPMNLLGDFAGGGLVCFLGIVLALYNRTQTGRGQIVEANMVDGAAFIATSPRLAMKTALWNKPRGTNLLDGGCPYYATYKTKDGGYIAVGALEPQFFAVLVETLSPYGLQIKGARDDQAVWPHIREQLTRIFASETRSHWESMFDGTDACLTPVLTQQELEASAYDQRPIVRLSHSPSLPITTSPGTPGIEGEGWESKPLVPGHGGDLILEEWMGWKCDQDYHHTSLGVVKGAGTLNKL